MVIVGVRLGGTPGFRVVNGGAVRVGDSIVVEGEDASRTRCRAANSDTAGPGDIFLEFSFLIGSLRSCLCYDVPLKNGIR